MSNIFTRIQPLSVVTLSEAKKQLNIIDFDDDDSLIEIYIEAATELAETYTGRLFSRCLVQLQIPAVSVCTHLPYGEIDLLQSVEIDEVGIDYTFNKIQQQITLTGLNSMNTYVDIIYDAGYGYNKVPAKVKLGIMIMISDFYNNRESVSEISVNELPFSAKQLLNSVRIKGY